MTDILWRLAWALPFVLVAGLVTMLALKRIVARPSAMTTQRRVTLCESLEVSDATSVHLLEVDGKPYLVVESSRQSTLQSASTQQDTQRIPRANWLQRILKVHS